MARKKERKEKMARCENELRLTTKNVNKFFSNFGNRKKGNVHSCLSIPKLIISSVLLSVFNRMIVFDFF